MISKKERESERAVHSLSLSGHCCRFRSIHLRFSRSRVSRSGSKFAVSLWAMSVEARSKWGWGRFSPLQKFSLLPLLIRLSTHLNRASTKAKGSVGSSRESHFKQSSLAKAPASLGHPIGLILTCTIVSQPLPCLPIKRPEMQGTLIPDGNNLE